MAQIHKIPRRYTFKILWDDMVVSTQVHIADDSRTAWAMLHNAIDWLEISYHQITLVSID